MVSKPMHSNSNDDAVEFKAVSNSSIAADMVITGNIKTAGNVDVIGELKGDLEAAGSVNITGSVEGNIIAKSLVVKGGKIKSELLKVKENINVEANSEVVGNIECENITVTSKVVGNIFATNSVNVNCFASIDGDIQSKSISVANGAKLNSRLTIDGE